MSARKLRALAPAAALAIAVACGNDRIKRNNEPIEVVSGQPTVGQILPAVLRGNADAGSVFGGAAPFQVDSFVQPKVSKVDILWVIDDSPSMDAKQQRVKANFVSFMQFLSDQQIDFHLGVVTTDTYNTLESGRLQNAARLSKPWIDLTDTPDGGAAVAFVTNASVGVAGSGDEKGLLGGMLALTSPLANKPDGGNCTSTECFLRPDAQLYTIIISDEEDSSCSPINGVGAGVNNSEGCDDGAATLSGYGSIAYWSRFFAGVKGPGGVSRVAAIVATDEASSFQKCATAFAGACDSLVTAQACNNGPDCTQRNNFGNACCQALRACSTRITSTAQWCEVHEVMSGNGTAVPPYYRVSGISQRNSDGTVTDLQGWPGCVHRDKTSQQVDFVGFNAHRYQKVAESTGGIATSICDDDYTPALTKLGLQASGLRADFPLSRAPVDGTLVVTVNGAAVATGPTTWQYRRCSGSQPANAIHFGCPNPDGGAEDPSCSKAALPGPDAGVAASYDVNVRGLGSCP